MSNEGEKKNNNFDPLSFNSKKKSTPSPSDPPSTYMLKKNPLPSLPSHSTMKK